MKLALQNNAVIMQIVKSCIKFSKLNYLQRYAKIIAICKRFVKENYDSNKTCRYVRDLLLHQTSFVWVQRFMSCLRKTNREL
jgi:hypothetical protein